MNWIAILKTMLKLTSSLAAYVHAKQLMEAGESKIIAESLKNAQAEIEKAREAKTSALRDFNKSNGVPDEQDPNLRD